MVTTRLTTFSSWRKLIQRVPEVPDLEPILFNTYLNYLFFLQNDIDICNFADDTAAYVCDIKLESVAEKLEENSESAVPWLEKNYTKLHTDKCHQIVSRIGSEHVQVKLVKDKTWESNNVKLLGVKMDNKLKFDEHISNIC